MAGTSFKSVYDLFLSKITDDMYMELSEADTIPIMEELLMAAINKFEFPRVNLFDYTLAEIGTEIEYDENLKPYQKISDYGHFNVQLSMEEMNILAIYMVVEWLGYQLAAIDNVRLKYSGSDFKFTSQANHLQKVLTLKQDYEREGFHMQRLYKRRRSDENGVMRSTFGDVMEASFK